VDRTVIEIIKLVTFYGPQSHDDALGLLISAKPSANLVVFVGLFDASFRYSYAAGGKFYQHFSFASSRHRRHLAKRRL